LDYEATDLQTDATGKYYTVQVVAKDPALNTSAVKDVKIYVTDVNETPANTPPHTIQLDGGTTDGVAESLGVGQAVGTLTAQDDSTPAAGITYSFVAGFNGNGHFTIDNTTKQIKVATALNFEDAVTTTPGAGLEQDAIGKFYRLKVIATDNATPALSSAEQEIKVYVTDFNEA
ncbi:cadherin repeat domain-containing protein, partial [Microvirga sp. 2MCAF35]|uniref:cadherin repeat domain-containing protein n=1 Tax=Microvirga sp. 2MCAF35 TaxID=3232987 RepID=UPI003F9BA47F